MSEHTWSDDCPACTCATCRGGAADDRRNIYGRGHGWVIRWGAPDSQVACPDCDGTGFGGAA